MDELTLHLTKIRRRYRLLDTAAQAQRTLWLPIAGMLLLQLAGRLLPIENLLLWSLVPLALWLLALPLTPLLRRFTLQRAARRVDEDLGLYERISTALELQQTPATPGYKFPSALIEKQHTDALQAVRAVDPRRDLPLAWLHRPLLSALTLAVLALAAIYLPNPMDAVLEQRRAVARAAAEQAERIEELKEEVSENPALTPEERQELARQLDELAAQLRANPGDLEEALADLARMEQALAERSDPNAAARQANLENLSQRLQTLAGMNADPQQPASESASQALAELAAQLAEQMGEMDPEQRQQTAAELGALSAQAALAGDPQLSQALSALAQAVQANSSQAVQSSAQQAQQALAQTAQQLSAQQALQQALQQLQQSRQAVAQAGQNAAQANQGQNASQPGSPGQNPGQGQSGDPGSSPGNSPGSGQTAGGGGSQASTLPPANSSGQAGRPQGNRPGATGELDEQVFAPWLHSAASGEELFIPGQDSNQGQTTSTEGSSPTLGAGSQALTPYYDVYYQYFNAANQAIQQGAIPASLADYVREYFSQLEP